MKKSLLWAWATILTLGTVYSAAQLAKDMFKLFLEVVCNPGLHSAGTNQWGRAGTEMKEKAAAMRYKVSTLPQDPRRRRMSLVLVLMSHPMTPSYPPLPPSPTACPEI